MTDFVKQERARQPHYARHYDPPAGARFRFKRHDPFTEWIKCPTTGAIMRLSTYQAKRGEGRRDAR